MVDFKVVHPGEIIKNSFLKPLSLSVTEAAEGLGVTRKTLSLLLNGKSGISPEMAMRLSMAFGRTPENWLKLQVKYDIEKMRASQKTFDVKRLAKSRKS